MDPGPRFFEVFEALTDDLVEMLHRAYSDASEAFEPAKGSNAQTFGMDVYAFVTHRLEGLASERGTGVAATQPFRVRFSEYTIGAYKVARDARSIHSAFPRRGTAAVTLVTEIVPRQGYLPGFAPNLAEARQVVLAHMGNERDGLLSAYLAFPINSDGAEITEWGYALELYRFDEASGGATPPRRAVPDRAPPSHPMEEVSDPVVTKRRKDKRKDEK